MTDSTPNWVRTAKAGDKVVCVAVTSDNSVTDLTIGNIYTIYAVEEGLGRNIATNEIENVLVILLEGYLYNPDTGRKFGYLPKNLTPLQTTKSTSKAIAKLRLLLDSKVSDEVSA